MSRIRVKTSTELDAHILAHNIREADAREIKAATGKEPIDEILMGLKLSKETWSIYVGKSLLAVGGIVPVPGSMLTDAQNVGWLLTSRSIEFHKKAFRRVVAAMLPQILGRWGTVTNAIDSRHVKAIRWAQRLGFKLQGAEPMGHENVPFHKFTVSLEDIKCAR
jgi:hypothetical protein